MERITGPGATPDKLFTEGDPSLGIDATTVTANWLNGVQEELIHILEEAGITPDGANLAQVLEALRTLFVRKDVPENLTPVIPETAWTPLESGITSTVKSKKMPDNTLHIYGRIDKAAGVTIPPGAPLLGITGDPFGIGAEKYILGIGFDDVTPTVFYIQYDSEANRTQLAPLTSWDSSVHFLTIWQVVPCLSL